MTRATRPCRGNTGRLLALLDGGLRPQAAEQLRRHLEQCASCTEALQRLKATRETLTQLGERELPDINYRQVEAQINWQLARHNSGARPARRLAVGLVPAVGALAVTLVVGGAIGALLLSRLHRPPTRSSPPTVAVRPAVAATAPPTERSELAALVTVMSGDVRVATEDGIIGPLTIARPVLPGERLMTHRQAAVAVQWAAGCGLRLEPNSEIRIAQLDTGAQRVELLRGRVDVEIAPRATGGQWSFSVVGGGLRAVVKGTRYSVALVDRATEVEVQRGLVAVSPLVRDARWRTASPPAAATGNGAIEVPAGYRLRFAASGAPTVSLADTGQLSRRPSLNLLPSWPSLQRLMATTGALEVHSRPDGADVRFDAALLGQTNLALRSTLGRHLLELWRGDELLRRQWVEVGLGSGEARVTFDMRSVQVRRPRLPAGIHEVFHQRAVQIRACYERVLKRSPELAGKIVLRVAISEAGEVSEATLDADTMPDPRIGRCAAAVVKRWRFPPGQQTEVVYPMVFRPR